MSQGSDADARVVVEADGLSVEKRFTADEFPVPAVQFTLRSTRDTPAEFRLVDRIPEEFPMDQIGFHPEYDNDGWTAYQDHRVEYRRRLDPGEELTTVYGIRSDDPDDGAKFLEEPTVEEVDEDADPMGNVSEVIGGDSTRVVRDVLSGEREAVPGGDPPTGSGGLDLSAAEADLDVDDGDASSDADDIPERETEAEPDTGATDAPAAESAPEATSDQSPESAVDDGDDDGGPVPDDAGTDTDPDRDDATADAETGASADHGETPAAGSDEVAAALAAELRAGTVAPADRETLRDELDLGDTTSVDARIARLQSNVEDLAAYTDALEEFLDDNGTAEELAEGLQNEVADLRETLSAVEGDVAVADDERDDLEAGLDEVRSDVDDLDGRLSTATDEMESSVADVRAEFDDLAAEVRAEDGAVAEVRDEVASLHDDVTSLSDRVDDEVGGLRDDLAEMRAEMREFEAFRDRLSSAFGAVGDGGTDVADGTGDAEETDSAGEADDE